MLTVLISGAIIALIIGIETVRIRAGRGLDFLSVFNGLFILNFCMPPLMIVYLSPALADLDPQGTLWFFQVVEKMGAERLDFTGASVWSLVAYLAVAGSYNAFRRPVEKLPAPDFAALPKSWLVVAGVMLAAVACIAIMPYVDSLGGLKKAMRLSASVRFGITQSKYAFLLHFILFFIPATLFMFAAAMRERRSYPLIAVTAVFWLLALGAVVQKAGRLDIAVFALLLPLAFYVRYRPGMRKLAPIAVLGAILSIALIQTGDVFFSRGAARALAALGDVDFVLLIPRILQEFAFPYVVLAHTLVVVPETVEYRYFYDFILGVQYLMPNLGRADALPLTANMLNGKMFGAPIPMDLLSHGIIYMGGAGLLIVALAHGAALRLADYWLAPDNGWLASLLRAWWMLYLPFRLMYGDPYNGLKSGFELWVGAAVVAAMVVAAYVRRQAGGQKPTS